MESMTEPLQHEELTHNLRPYIDWFLRWVWLMGLLAVGLAIVVYGISVLCPPKYEAKAAIVLLRARTEISLGSAFQTLSQEDINLTSSSGAAVGAASVAQALEADRITRRLNSLMAIVPSGDVAQRASQELQGVLSDEERTPVNLASHVAGRIYQPDPKSTKATPSDTILIVAANRDPGKAAAIANAWARAYETYVNQIYGQSSSAPFAQIATQVKEAQTQYDQAEAALLKYLSEQDRVTELQRQIAEEETIIQRLRAGRQTAISAIVDKQVAIKQQLINNYLENDVANRLLAFNQGQEAQRQILSTWLHSEVANRIAAINRDREVRMGIFSATVGAEIDTRERVFEQQRNDLLAKLAAAYARRNTLRNLLSEAYLMRDQLTTGGDASARSNALSLLAFKGRVFGATEGLPSFDKLDLQAASIDALAEPRSASEQLADLDGLIKAMEAEVQQQTQAISEQSTALLQGEGYQSLDLLSPQYLATSSSLTGTQTISQSLDALISQLYTDLFNVGSMAQSTKSVATDTPIYEQIAALYPKLFSKDAIAKLDELVGDKSELSAQANQMANDLFRMQGWENVISSTVNEMPLSQEITQREDHVRLLQADVARIAQVKVDLQQDRDLAWNAYKTLLAKQQEVSIAAASEGTEVRFASPAVPPTEPVSSPLKTSVMGFEVGLVISFVAAMVLEYKGANSDPRYWLARGRMLFRRPASR